VPELPHGLFFFFFSSSPYAAQDAKRRDWGWRPSCVPLSTSAATTGGTATTCWHLQQSQTQKGGRWEEEETNRNTTPFVWVRVQTGPAPIVVSAAELSHTHISPKSWCYHLSTEFVCLLLFISILLRTYVYVRWGSLLVQAMRVSVGECRPHCAEWKSFNISG
jgi:hypothetical protein